MADEGRKGDEGATEGADNTAAEQTHQESAFEREIGEAVGVADETQGDAEDERRHHEEHEFEFLVGVALFGKEDAAESVPAREESGDGGGHADLQQQGEKQVAG